MAFQAFAQESGDQIGESYMRLLLWTTLMSLAFMPWARAATFDARKRQRSWRRRFARTSNFPPWTINSGTCTRPRSPVPPITRCSRRIKRPGCLCAINAEMPIAIKKAYADRINVLEGTSTPPLPEDFTGTYKTENAEVLVQQTANGRLKFYISATYHTNDGEVSGEVPLTGNAARYVDKELDCALSFKFAPSKLVVTQDGSCGMGLNVSGSGSYKRVSSAPPKFED
jgi:hypothetical protein